MNNFFIRLYEINEMKQILNKIGFTKIKAVKAYNKNDIPDKDDDTMIFECKL